VAASPLGQRRQREVVRLAAKQPVIARIRTGSLRSPQANLKKDLQKFVTLYVTVRWVLFTTLYFHKFHETV